MAGGGHIIIHSKVRETAELECVKTLVAERFRTKYLRILGKDNADWTKEEFEFLQRHITIARNKLCAT